MPESNYAYRCRIYEERPEWCRGYPWGLENDLFPWCQFTKETEDGLELIAESEVGKTQEEMQDFCIHCGACCMFWEDGKVIHKCSALIVEEAQEKRDAVTTSEEPVDPEEPV
jgi:Fe-S-cluster containining protein